jgi:hypothetical protein
MGSKMSSTSSLDQRVGDAVALEMLGQPVDTNREPALEFQIVPKHPKKSTSHPTPSPWRLVLANADSPFNFKALEIHGDAVIGADPDSDDGLDVNMSDWQGRRSGVSRRHILLRPNGKRLFVMDLQSASGTDINGLPLGVGWAYALRDGDLISLGHLHLRVRIVQYPS